MIQHTNKMKLIITLLFVIINFGCKENIEKKELKNSNISDTVSQNSYSSINNVEENNIKKNKNTENWKFYKVVPIYNGESCDIEKYRNFKFNVINDSVYINQNYTDDVFSGEIKSETLLKKHSLTKEFLNENFNVNVPITFKYIRNKKASQSESKLNLYFEDAFYIDNYLFFEKGDCLYCFVKEVSENKTSINYDKIGFPLSNDKLSKIKSYSLKEPTLNQYKCGGDDGIMGYYIDKINNFSIYIVENGCGDFIFKDLVILKDGKLISKILVESESWDVEKMESSNIKNETLTTFNIDSNFKLSIKTINKLQNVIVSEKIAKYKMDLSGQLVTAK